MTTLDGPRVAPLSPPATALVVLLHGYGANGDDLIALAPQWASLLPEAAFVAPHAAEDCPGGFGGRQWFDLTFRDPAELWRGVSHAGPALERFLDSELRRHKVHPERLALVGFSQGTMMALHVGLRRGTAPAAILGYSGLLAGPEHLKGNIKCRPPVLLIHGDADELIPIEAMHMAAAALAEAGVAVSWHVSRNMGHGIDPQGQLMGGRFLAESLKLAVG